MVKDYQKARKKDKIAILDYFMRTADSKNRNYTARILRQYGKTVYVGKKKLL